MSIFNFPDYAAKPKTKLTMQLLQDITTLNPGSPDNARLISIYLKTFDKKPKYTFYENALQDIPAYWAEIMEFLSLASMTYMQRDYSQEVNVVGLLKAELSIFFKFVLFSAMTLDPTGQ